jgi:Ca-activated chloride channel homolog
MAWHHFVAYLLTALLSGTIIDAERHDGSGSMEAGALKAHVNLVLVPVMVTDANDRLVLGSQKDNFRIYDARVRQVLSYSTEDAPISLEILSDASASMCGKVERSREALMHLLNSTRLEDEFSLVFFDNRPELATDFTDSIQVVQSEISKAKPDGTTALLDVVYLGLSRMRYARNRRTILLIISDSGDNHSRYARREVLSTLAGSNVQTYALGIFDYAPRTSEERAAPDLLAAMTDISGGSTFRIHDPKKIRDAVTELGIELHNRYLTAYHPTSPAHDGKWHRVQVQVTPPANTSLSRFTPKPVITPRQNDLLRFCWLDDCSDDVTVVQGGDRT